MSAAPRLDESIALIPPDEAPKESSSRRQPGERFGLSCALITPVLRDGRIDAGRLVAHAKRVLDQGCTSITAFGTTGEGASFGLRERAVALEALERGGLDFGTQVLVATAAASAEDTATQANQALDAGARGLLLPPPFYFQAVGDEGLYRWFCAVLDTCRAPRGVFLYHIPSVTGVPLSPALIERLARAYPGIVVGVKDSGGEWSYTERLLEAQRRMHILVGDERLLARAMREGGSGAINGFSNFCAPRLASLIDGHEDPRISALVDVLLEMPVTPGIKALVAEVTHDAAYALAAPPLTALEPSQRERLLAQFRTLGEP